MKKSLLLIFLLLFTSFSHQFVLAQVTTTTSGNWQNNGNWSSANYPDGNCGCTEIIISYDILISGSGSAADKLIDLTTSSTLTKVTIKANTTLTFDNNTRMLLPSGASIVLESGAKIIGPTNNSGSLIKIGNNEIWGNSCSDCTSAPLTGPGSMDENSNPQNPLPVEFLYVSGESDRQSMVLLWATASETNNSHFVVERSADGRIFTAIGEVEGGGTSTVELRYSFVDKNPWVGSNFYRLKQVDYDGASDFSRIMHLLFTPQNEDRINIYPNRVKDHFVIELLNKANGPVSISLYNQLGSKVMEWKHKEGGRLFTNYIEKGLETGVYIVKILRSGEAPTTGRVIVE